MRSKCLGVGRRLARSAGCVADAAASRTRSCRPETAGHPRQPAETGLRRDATRVACRRYSGSGCGEGHVKPVAESPVTAQEYGEFRVYVIEVCHGCGWNFLTVSFVPGTGEPRDRRGTPAFGRGRFLSPACRQS
nr:DUF5318 family protein [Rhizohabitans arisaemae]